MEMPLAEGQPQTRAVSLVWSAVVVFLIALAVRLVASATLPLLRDEAWHLLAAHSWIHDGTLRVDQGAYTRASYFTVLVAWFMEAFGETLTVARLPGILAGAALVAAVFEWLRRQSGVIAAWTGAMLLCFQDLSILLSTEVRFYTLHALCLWLTAAIIYRVAENGRDWRQACWMLAIAAVLSAFALHLQVTAGVALAAIVAWAICDIAYRCQLWHWLRGHRVPGAAAVIIVLAGAIAIGLHPPAALVEVYKDFRHTSYWAAPGQDWALFYQRYYSETITLLWGLLPIAFIIALVHRPRAALFCAFLFVVPIVVMSFGGMKRGRYIFFALPYFFAIWGLAAGAVFPGTARLGAELWRRACDLVSRPDRRSITVLEQRLRRHGFAPAAILLLAFAVISQPSYRESAKIIVKSALAALTRPAQILTGPAPEPWASHRGELMAMMKRASIVIASMPSTTMLELGAYQLILNRNALDESPDEGEYAVDRRVGRPTISTLESLRTVVNCYPTGIAIIPSEFWRDEAAVSEEVSNFLMQRAKLTRMKGPGTSEELLVFEWESNPAPADPVCSALRTRLAAPVSS